jgi:hypothetical protein
MEVYKNIKEFENYSVSNFGNVKNNKTGRILIPSVNRGGYYYVHIYRNGISKTMRIHRLVAEAFLENPQNKPCVDHIDNNRVNNRLENLRFATYSENTMNSSKYKNNTSGVIGVIFDMKCNKWCARITINGKQKHIGYFKTLEEAKSARIKKANELFGEFTNKLEKIKTNVINALSELEQLEQEFNNLGN